MGHRTATSKGLSGMPGASALTHQVIRFALIGALLVLFWYVVDAEPKTEDVLSPFYLLATASD